MQVGRSCPKLYYERRSSCTVAAAPPFFPPSPRVTKNGVNRSVQSTSPLPFVRSLAPSLRVAACHRRTNKRASIALRGCGICRAASNCTHKTEEESRGEVTRCLSEFTQPLLVIDSVTCACRTAVLIRATVCSTTRRRGRPSLSIDLYYVILIRPPSPPPPIIPPLAASVRPTVNRVRRLFFRAVCASETAVENYSFLPRRISARAFELALRSRRERR